MLTTLHEHTIDDSLLTERGAVLDAGCRGFEFGTWFVERGHPVVFVDPAPDVEPPASLMDRGAWCEFHRAALVGEGLPKECGFTLAGNGTRIVWGLTGTPTVTVRDLMGQSVKCWDVVKLDIEGAEYAVLLSWPGPVSRQITVEFHEHTGQGMAMHGADVYERIDAKLKPWYQRVKWEPLAFAGGVNVYDALWVLR